MHETLKNIIESLLEGSEIHLVDLSVSPRGKKQMLEVFVDTEAGITADELAVFSRGLEEEIEKRSDFNLPYTLEVSSPGLERPVRFPWQYRRHTGRQVNVAYRKADEQMVHTGEIVEVDDDQLIVRDGEGLRAIPHENIERAVIQATL